MLVHRAWFNVFAKNREFSFNICLQIKTRKEKKNIETKHRNILALFDRSVIGKWFFTVFLGEIISFRRFKPWPQHSIWCSLGNLEILTTWIERIFMELIIPLAQIKINFRRYESQLDVFRWTQSMFISRCWQESVILSKT